MISPDTLPILIVAFRRPKNLEMVLNSISNRQNPVYIWIDGPRDLNDLAAISECVELIQKNTCLNLKGIFQSPRNVGIGYSIPTAINWVFEYVSEVLILEDDIVIDSSFFKFAAFSLEKFKDTPEVSSVIGFNCVPVEHLTTRSSKYRFSAYTSSWAWATWRSKWESMVPYMLEGLAVPLCPPKSAKNIGGWLRWGAIHKRMRKGVHVSWDHRWLLVNWYFKKFHIVSNSNLCLNIGFDSDSTHTFKRPSWVPLNIETQVVNEFEPLGVEQDVKADKWLAKNVYKSLTTLMLKDYLKSVLSRYKFLKKTGL